MTHLSKPILCCLAVVFLFFTACNGSRKSKKETPTPLVINESTAKVFGQQLERSANEGVADFYNESFDETHLKELIGENSIVKSSLDSDFGLSYFKSYMQFQGNQCNEVINNGGDYKCVKIYEKEGVYHLVFRKYIDLGNMEIFDYQLSIVDNKIKIANGFLYNNSASLANDLLYTILYEVMKKTNPEGETAVFVQIRQLLDAKKTKEALLLLNQEKQRLSSYPYYIDLYIRALFEVAPKDFLVNIAKMESDNMIDKRTALLHTLLFCSNQGLVNQCQETIEALINFSGDDPIYLLFFAHAQYEAKSYQDAIACYHLAAENLPYLWDIWYGELSCYDKLHDTDNFFNTLEKSKTSFNFTDDEVKDFLRRHFPNAKR
ncbi:MAG: hypothetical protein LBV46_03055 [Bacteroidales bacterium]|jgi:hypothetical protein|nr:hypothetical protein [Bacteroidales bacterium]